MSLDSPLRAALLSLLGSRPTPARRRALADHLQSLADEQRHLAEADEQVGHVARSVQRDAANAIRRAGGKGGRPRGTGGRFVRWVAGQGYTGQLHIAPALYQELGEPERLDVQRIGGLLHLRGATGSDGYAVVIPTGPRGGMPRISIGRESADILGLIEGRRQAEVRGGAIVVSPEK